MSTDNRSENPRGAVREGRVSGHKEGRCTMSINCFISGLLLVMLACLVLAPSPLQARPGERLRLVIFDMELQDVSHEGELRGKRDDETARIALLSAELRKLIGETQRYEIVDVTAAAAESAEQRPLRSCNGCDIEIARRFGASQSLLGIVYKVSNLILEIHLYLRDTNTGQVINHMHANIRGNNNTSWLHGLRWLIRNRLVPSE